MQINLKNFKLLHNHLLSILSTNNFGTENLPEKIMQYIGMIVEAEKSPKKSQDFFDYFCQNNGNKILKLTLEADPFLAVKVLSMLFINLKSKTWISFLLCQPFVTESIQCDDDMPQNQEWAEYYISLLKSLSIRLNNEDLSLFFNKKFCKFPLLYESLKYYNHPDCMVRTNVMNIILGVMRIKDPRLSRYFSNFPFTSYILTLCCQIKERIQKFQLHLLEWDYCQNHKQSPQSIFSKHKSIIKMYFIDMSDYICYLNDLIGLGSKQLGFFIKNAIFSYILLPALKKLLPQNKPIIKKSALYLIFILLKSINDDQFTQTVCLLLFARQLPKYFLDRINSINEELYIPKVYSADFSINNYYWNKFGYQIQKNCIRFFEDINNFETDHQSKEEDHQLREEFLGEMGNIGRFLGFDILTYKAIQGVMPLSELRATLSFAKQQQFHSLSENQLKTQQNIIRESVMQFYKKSCEQLDDDICLTISILLIYCVKCDCISNKVLQFCGLLMPRFDIVNYKEQFNLNSLIRFKDCILSALKLLIKKYDGKQELVADCSLACLRNMMFILENVHCSRLEEENQIILGQFYSKSLLQVKSLIKPENTNNLVQNFEFDMSKWSKQALIPDHSLPYTIFHKDTSELVGEIQLHFIKQFSTHKQAKVQYFIRYLAISQTYYYRYIEQFIIKENIQSPVLIEKFQGRYLEKFGKIQEKLEIGKSYVIGHGNMIECRRLDKNNKFCRLIFVSNNHNLIIVEPSNEENSAKVIINHPWKYAQLQIDKTNNKNIVMKISKCIRSQSLLNLIFIDEIRSVSTLESMNVLKKQRYQAQQALIFNYIKDCLVRY